METQRKFERVCEIVDQNGRNPARLIPILQAVQAEYRYLPEEILTFVATSLGISPARVFGVATFYSLFTLKPKGKYVVRVCDGTACHVKRSMRPSRCHPHEAAARQREGDHARHALHRRDGQLSRRLRPRPRHGGERRGLTAN